jgi:hypothetical protein
MCHRPSRPILLLQLFLLTFKHPLWLDQVSSSLFILLTISDPFCGPLDNRDSASVSPTPHDFALAKGEQEGESRTQNAGGEQVSAADYDPSLDRREDEYKRLGDKVPNVGTVDEEIEEEEDVEDMFAVVTSDKKVKKVKKIVVSSIHWYGSPDNSLFSLTIRNYRRLL